MQVHNDSKCGSSRRTGFEPGSTVRVAFVNFWPDFDASAFLIPLLQARPFKFDVEVVAKRHADIEICSVFRPKLEKLKRGVKRKLYRQVTGRTTHGLTPSRGKTSEPIRIWLTGENIRPPVDGWDVTLSFDVDSLSARNAYFPLWWQMFPEILNSPDTASPGIVQVSRFWPLESYLSRREGEAGEREKFLCAVISNPEPTRMLALESLQRLGSVDVYGRVVGRPVHDKYEVFRNYQFALCFESDLYPGYVTEKLFDAWGAGCIPLWWGLDRGSHLNPNAFVNLASLPGIDGLLVEVDRLLQDERARRTMSSLPLLLRAPNLDGVRGMLARSLLNTA